jgi:hypothetical protein
MQVWEGVGGSAERPECEEKFGTAFEVEVRAQGSRQSSAVESTKPCATAPPAGTNGSGQQRLTKVQRWGGRVWFGPRRGGHLNAVQG